VTQCLAYVLIEICSGTEHPLLLGIMSATGAVIVIAPLAILGSLSVRAIVRRRDSAQPQPSPDAITLSVARETGRSLPAIGAFQVAVLATLATFADGRAVLLSLPFRKTFFCVPVIYAWCSAWLIARQTVTTERVR